MLTGRNAFKILLAVGLAALNVSCQNNTEVPMPAVEQEYQQPVSQPLHFSEETKIRWTDSVPLKPMVKRFAFNNLPVKFYDSTGFLPFSKKPLQFSFDVEKLRDTIFNYESLPSKPLKFETSLFEVSLVIKGLRPHIKPGLADIIYEFDDPFIGSQIRALMEDSRGMMWIATAQALFSYDGENLSQYIIGSGKYSITGMLEDREGKIWLGTDNNCLYMLDIKSGTKTYISILFGSKDYVVGNMFLDRQNRIWFATDNHSVEAGNPSFIIDQSAMLMKKLSREEGIPNGSGMIQDSSGRIWMASFGQGIYIIDPDKRKMKYLNRFNGLIGDTLVDIRYNGKNGLLAANFHGDFSKVDIEHNTITNYDERQGLSINVNVYAKKIFEDQIGNIWIDDAGLFKPGFGIEIIDPVKETLSRINNMKGITGGRMFDMVEDHRGQIWIGTDAGLNVLPGMRNSIKHIGTDNTTTLAEDGHGNIWIGIVDSAIKILDTATGFVKILNNKNGLSKNYVSNIDNVKGSIFVEGAGGLDIIDSSFKTIRHIGKIQGLKKDSVRQAYLDREGRIWIYGFGANNLSVVDLKKEKIFRLGKLQGLRDSTVNVVKEDTDGNIWITGSKDNINLLNPKTNIMKGLDSLSPLQNVGGKILMPDKDGNMWIGTKYGIYMINAKKDSVLHFSKREGLAGEIIISLNEYDHDIYAGSKDGGISIIIPPAFSENNKWNILRVGKSHGINKIVRSQESDIITKDGRFLWGDKGITILRKSFLKSDSVKNYICGVDLLNKPLYFTNKSIPEIYGDTIRNVAGDTFYLRKNARDYSANSPMNKIKWDSVSGRYNMPVNLQFPYDENYLQFHFLQEGNFRKDTVWYRYMLVGIDKKWSDKTITESSQNYLNLPPGNYSFKVTSLSNGKWTTPASFSFRILPPWWETGWAYSLFVFALIGLIWISISYRSKQLLRQNRMLEDKVTLRTQELVEEKEKVEYTLSELRTTQSQLIQSEKMASLGELTAGIAHEIQNPLNFVNNFSEVNKELLLEMKDEMQKGNVKEACEIANNIIENETKINHHGKRADAIVKSMLQHSQLSAGKKEMADINAIADEYLNLAYHGLRAKEKSFNAKLNTDYDKTIGNIFIIPQDIGRVLLNLYNNAFYAVNEKAKLKIEGFEPALWISTKKLKNSVELRVRDNGGGIPSKVLDKVFQPFFTTKPTGQGTGLGLSLSYDIIKAHGGDLKIIAKEGEGAEFLIQIPVV
jgi:signal transduction histidine kinase/ligand-binding sensor domain-containing protein